MFILTSEHNQKKEEKIKIQESNTCSLTIPQFVDICSVVRIAEIINVGKCKWIHGFYGYVLKLK